MASGLSGITSGMDWGALIEETIKKARKPAEQWEKQVELLNLKKEIYGKISSNFFELRSGLTQLKLESTYLSKQAEVTATDAGKNAASILKVTTKPESPLSNWRINVLETATAKTFTSVRKNSPSDPLDLEGKFQVFVGQQMGEITIEKKDSLREINLKLNNLKDQWGQPMAMEAMLLDNRLVIKSSKSGLDSRSVKLGEKLTVADGMTTYLPRTNTGIYPPQLCSVTSGANNYLVGTDFDYSATDGTITWKTGKKPATNVEIDVVYADIVKIKTAAANGNDPYQLPALKTGAIDFAPSTPITIKSVDGATTYVEGTDYTFDRTNRTITWTGFQPGNDKELLITVGSDTAYGTNYNETYLKAVGNSTILKDLGFSDAAGVETPSTKARDAELEVNGVKITRSSNKIDDVIGSTTLELIGKGEVILDISTDAQKAVENIEKLVESYNKNLTLINDLLAEKQQASTGKDEDTVFGLFHGDQLLASLKNQLRNYMMNPNAKLAPVQATQKYASNVTPLGLEGSFYVTVGGKMTRIDVAKTNTLNDIENILLSSQNSIKQSDANAAKTPMPLSVSFKNGQLVITSSSTATGQQTKTENIKRTDADYDLLPFAYSSAAPINGKLAVSTRSKTYYEGLDFDVVTVPSASDPKVLESRLMWRTPDKPPKDSTYSVTHTYTEKGVLIEPVEGTTPQGEDNIVAKLGFHLSTSNATVTGVGLATEAADYGKSGLLEFDSAKLMDAMKDDPKNLSDLMTNFMRDFDALIGNFVDSSGSLIGGQVVTKGRIASKTQSIDSEISELNKRISTLDRRLVDRQKSLYQQYTAMETAMAKLNAQMASMQQFFSKSQSA